MRGSLIRCFRKRISQAWLTVSKYDRMSASRTKFTFLLVIPNQGVQRIMLAALRSESVREPEEVFLVDRVQDSDSRPLDDLVLKGGNREWALPTVRFGYVDAPGRQGPICSFMKAVSVGPGYWDQGLPRRLATLPHPLRVRHSP